MFGQKLPNYAVRKLRKLLQRNKVKVNARASRNHIKVSKHITAQVGKNVVIGNFLM
jgi:hypothetical protein